MEHNDDNTSSENTALGEFDKAISRRMSVAETIESSQKVVEDDPTTCQICQKRYKRPRLLQCLHVFCTSCLIMNRETKKNGFSIIQCHICNEITTLPPGGVLDLPVDVMFSAMVDEDGDFDERPCTTCKRVDNAVAQCNNCDAFICQFCEFAHDVMTKFFSWHKVSTMSNLELLVQRHQI